MQRTVLMTEIWRPSPARVADANLTRFMECLNARKGLQLRDYDELYRVVAGAACGVLERAGALCRGARRLGHRPGHRRIRARCRARASFPMRG